MASVIPLPPSEAGFAERVRCLLGADATCFWRADAAGVAVLAGCSPPHGIRQGFERPRFDPGEVRMVAGPEGRAMLPPALRDDLPDGDREAIVLGAQAQDGRCGFFARWMAPKRPSQEATSIAAFACDQWMHLGAYAAVLANREENAARLDGVVNSLPQGIVILPAEGGVGLANAAAAAWLDIAAGWADARVLAGALRRLAAQADNAIDAAVWLDATLRSNSGPASGHELLFAARGVTLRVTLAPLMQAPSGGWAWLIEDASDAMRSRERLETAASSGIIGIWDWNIVTNQLYWDDVMYALYGLRQEDFGGAYEAWASALHPEDRQASEAAVQAVMQGGTRYEAEFRVIWPDGSIHHLRAVGRTTRDAQGKVVRLSGVNYDITQLKSLAQELRGTLADKDAILNSEVAGFWMTRNRVTLWLNDVAAADLGYKPDELIGKPTRVCYPDDDSHRRFGEARVAAFAQGGTFHTQWQWRHKDGNLRWFDITAVPQPSDPETTIWVAVQIDSLKRTEAQLRLATTVAEAANEAKSAFLATMSHEIRTPLNAIIGTAYLLGRTTLAPEQKRHLATIEVSSKNLLSLINDVLDFSKIEAGEFTFERQEFPLAEVLQDLRVMFSPVAATKGLSLEFREPAAGVPSRLVGDGPRLSQMLRNLLGNAVKFTNEGSVTLEVVETARNAVQGFVSLRFQVTDTGVGIAPEAQTRLFQAFSQADSSTSRRFGGSGLGLSIVRRMAEMLGGSVGLQSQPGKGSTFWFELPFSLAADSAPVPSGAAVTQAMRVLVAEGQQPARKRRLAACASFGWEVEGVDSAAALDERVQDIQQGRQRVDCILVPEEGPMVLKAAESGVAVCVLPADATPSDLFNAVNEAVFARTHDLSQVIARTDIRSGAEHWLAGVQVLVVDDSAINREVLELLLSGQGAVTRTCASGAEALQAIRAAASPFDVILMDLQMPEMDGCEATRRIRQQPALARLPVIALTAGATTTQKQDAMDAGMDDFLTKPVDPPSLIRALRRHVERFRGRPLMILPVDAAPATAPRTWPDMAGIDKAEARRALGGDVDRFKALLGRFVDENADSVARIRSLIDAGDDGQAAALAHSLGGQAAFLGALHLYRAAAALELAIRDRSGEVEACFLRLAEAAGDFF